MTRPLVYVQVPEVVEIVKQAQAVIDKKKLKEGELPIKEIVEEQNLPDMMLLRHVWGYGKDDVGKKTIAAIIYKYLKERMFPKEHVMTAFLSTKFATTSSTLHKYIVGMKYKGGAPPGKYRYEESEEWTRRQMEEDANKGASGSGTTMSQEKPKGKGVGKKSGKKRDVAEIHEEMSKPKKKRKQDDDDDDDDQPGTSKPKKKRREVYDDEDEEDKDCDRPLKAPVMARGLVIRN